MTVLEELDKLKNPARPDTRRPTAASHPAD